MQSLHDDGQIIVHKAWYQSCQWTRLCYIKSWTCVKTESFNSQGMFKHKPNCISCSGFALKHEIPKATGISCFFTGKSLCLMFIWWRMLSHFVHVLHLWLEGGQVQGLFTKDTMYECLFYVWCISIMEVGFKVNQTVLLWQDSIDPHWYMFILCVCTSCPTGTPLSGSETTETVFESPEYYVLH